MATKKPAATKKPVKKRAVSSAAKTTTKVTTAMSAPTAAAAVRNRRKFNFSRSTLLSASLAEFFGTFMLAAIVFASSGQAIIVLFAVMAIALAVGAVSGAHLNPAITLGAFVTRRINGVRALSYVVAQVLGAMLALVLINAYVSAAPEVSSQAAMYGQQSPEVFKLAELASGKEWLILGAELLGAALFAFGFASATRERSRTAFALTIGGALFVALAVTGYLVSLVGMNVAVINPALALSLQGLAWSWWPIFIYVVAPVVGGVIGFALRDLLTVESTEV